jgi:hypothetical protein
LKIKYCSVIILIIYIYYIGAKSYRGKIIVGRNHIGAKSYRGEIIVGRNNRYPKLGYARPGRPQEGIGGGRRGYERLGEVQEGVGRRGANS